MTKKVLIFLALAALTACAGPRPDDEAAAPEAAPPPQLPVFEQGVRALEKEQYAEAAKIFDKLLVTKPATEHDLVTSFNSGSAYEGLGNCSRAGERYREVTRGSSGHFTRLEAQAFYRLALMYECLGQDVKSITALLDAKKRGRNLPPATLSAEIPARLAAAYARIGNRKKALEYFALANKGLKKIVSEESGKKQADILGQSLYLMGQLNPAQRRGEGDPKAFLQGLGMQQPYLLQAVELKHPVWSPKAASDLETAYDNIWKFKFTDTEAQNDFYIRAMQAVRELKRIKMPNETPEAAAIFRKVDAVESRLNIEIAKVAESTKLTPEAEKRQALKRQGRLITPAPPAKAPKKKR
jgi:tetratricopeptide (TPR) repeat protein